MPQYLLNVIQPDGEPPEPAVLEPIMADLRALHAGDRGRGPVGLHRRTCTRRAPRRSSATATARRCSPTARSPRPTSTSAASRSSRRRTSTPRSPGPPGWRRPRRCRSRSGRSPTATSGRRTCLPRGVRPRGGGPGPRLRRHRRRRGGRAGRVHRSGAAVARERATAEPGRLDHHHGAQSRDRPLPPRGDARGAPARGGRGACGPRAVGGGGSGARRSAAADLHLLPPVARDAERRWR